jgi:hypothetical protein
MQSSSSSSFWSAPASVASLANSSWHIIALRKKGSRISSEQSGQNGWNVSARNVFQAGHFALTGHGDVLDARTNRLPTGRTPGRALRAFRRKLQRDPVAFSEVAQ